MSKKVKCGECDCLMQFALPQVVTKDNYEYAKYCFVIARETGRCGIVNKTKRKDHEQYCRHFRPIDKPEYIGERSKRLEEKIRKYEKENGL